ncbi:MAG: SPOR domain-containing protein [Candidatus Marinimicrobia bacterium]|nr:SPOR domain-containing protein [Candidatus Neomarinimicrobiota bacterium]
MVNKTVKVFSQGYHKDAENYTFKWEPPVGPSKIAVPFDLKNDMLIFSPELEGNYQIHLSITDISDDVVAEEMFYYRAIPETLEVAIAKPSTEMETANSTSTVKKPKKKKKRKKEKKNQSKSRNKQNNSSKTTNILHYTIQVAAWPSLEHARMDQLKLIEEGLDAYIQRHYRNEKDEVWYRVRIGNFNSKAKAIVVQKQIESITHAKTWLDILPTE